MLALEKIEEMKGPAVKAIDDFKELSEMVVSEKAEAEKAAADKAYAQALEDVKAPAGVKVYSEEEFEAAKAEIDASHKDRIEKLEGQVSGFDAEKEAFAKEKSDLEAKVSASDEKVAGLEKQLKEQGDQSKIDAALVDERKAMVGKYQGFVSGIRNAKVDDAKVADDMEAAAKELQEKIDAVPAEPEVEEKA